MRRNVPRRDRGAPVAGDLRHILVEPCRDSRQQCPTSLATRAGAKSRRDRARNPRENASAGSGRRRLEPGRGKARFLLRPPNRSQLPRGSAANQPVRQEAARQVLRDPPAREGTRDREPPRPASPVVDLLDARRHRPARLGERQRRRDADQLVQLIQRRFGTDVCSVYLLEPDRVEPGAGGDRSACGPRASAASACGSTEGLVGLVAEQLRPLVVDDATTHPRFKYFREAGEDPYQLVPRRAGHRPRRCCRACWSCRRSSRAPSADDDVRHAGDGRRAAGADRQRGAHARASSSRRRTSGCAALAQNLWWSWDHDTTSLFRDLDPVLWRAARPQPDRAAAADAARRSSRSAPSQLALHSRINYAYRRLQEYLASTHTWGATPRRRAAARGRSPTSRPSSACTSRCRSTPAASASWPATTSRAPPTSASRSSASACSTTRATSGSGSTATAGSTRSTSTSTSSMLPMRAGDRRRRRAGDRRRSRRAPARSRRASGRCSVGRSTLLLLDSDVEGNSPRTAS